MKRKEIAELLEETGQIMEFFDVTEVKDIKNDEILLSVSKDVINGMQTAIYMCKKVVSGAEEIKSPVQLAAKIISLYAACKSGFGDDAPDCEDESEESDD